MSARLCSSGSCPAIFLAILLALPSHSRAANIYESLAILPLLFISEVHFPQFQLWHEKAPMPAEYQGPPFAIILMIADPESVNTSPSDLKFYHAANTSDSNPLIPPSDEQSLSDLIMPSPTKTEAGIIQLPHSKTPKTTPPPLNTPDDDNQQQEEEEGDKEAPPHEAPQIPNHNGFASNDDGGPSESSVLEDGTNPICQPDNIQIALRLGAGDGGDPGDPDDNSSLTAQNPDDSDDIKKRFEELEKEVKNLRCNPIKKWQLVWKLFHFAQDHWKYATPCFQLAEQLIRWESLTVNILVKTAYNGALAISAFNNTGDAIIRTAAVVIGSTVGNMIPWFFPEQTWLEFLSLTGGSTLIAATDNLFAHRSNSSYALPWLSNDYVNFNMRVIFLINTNVWVSKYLYSRLLIGNLAKFTHKNLIPLMVFDFLMKPLILYLNAGVVVGTVPVICVVCAPNPIAPHSFPYPNYCPSVRWVFWQLNCNETTVTDEVAEGECLADLPLNSTDCNCTCTCDKKSPSMKIEHEL